MNENDSTHDQCEVPALTEADYLAAAKAGSTRKEYQKDMRYFVDAGYAIPATVDQVATYLAQMAGHLAVSTIDGAWSACMWLTWRQVIRRLCMPSGSNHDAGREANQGRGRQAGHGHRER